MLQLSTEKARWQTQVSTIGTQLANLLPQAVVAAACATYLGPLAEAERRARVEQWRGLLCVAGGEQGGGMVSLLSSEVEVGEWKASGMVVWLFIVVVDAV